MTYHGYLSERAEFEGRHPEGCNCLDCTRWFAKWHPSGLCYRCTKPLDDHGLVGVDEPRCKAAA